MKLTRPLASHVTPAEEVDVYSGWRPLFVGPCVPPVDPDSGPTGAVRPVLLPRLRGRTTLGATVFAVASDYADRIEAVGGRLYLTELAPALAARLSDPARPRLTGGAVL